MAYYVNKHLYCIGADTHFGVFWGSEAMPTLINATNFYVLEHQIAWMSELWTFILENIRNAS